MNAITPAVFVRDETVLANSRDVAAFFEKEHRNVLRDIDQLIEKQQSSILSDGGGIPEGWFEEHVEYRPAHNPGRPFRSFDMTRDGFTLLAMGFTGPKALRFKLAYIKAFNAMEAALKDAALTRPASDDMSETPFQDRRLWLDSVSLAMRVYGVGAARRLWAASPLPQVGEDPDPAPADTGSDLDGAGCLERLLSWRPLAGMPSLGEMLADGTALDHRRALLRNGIDPAPRGHAGFFAVAYTARCRPLAARFAGTAWAGKWVPALLQVAGAKRSRQSIWVGTTSSKAVMVPLP